MEGVLFLIFWLGCAGLHTLFDLKVMPALKACREDEETFRNF